MYHLYEKQTEPFVNRKHIRDFEDVDDAYDYVDKKLAENKDFKYIIEETTGIFNSYGELVINTIEEN